MTTKQDVLTAVRTLNDSVRELEQAALGNETQLSLLVEQGRTTNTTLGALVSAVGQLTDRLGAYLDNANELGGRVNTLERDVRELRNAGQ